MDCAIRSPPSQAVFEDISEKPHEHPRRAWTFYFVLIFAVLPVWSIVPLSWAFVIYTLWSGIVWNFSWTWRAMFGLAVCEVLFNGYYLVMSRHIGGPTPMPSPDLDELQTAYARVLRAGLGLPADLPPGEHNAKKVAQAILEEDITPLDFADPRAIDFRHFLRTWFGKVSWSAIHKENVYSWLYWSIFNAPLTSLDELPRARRKLVEETVELLEGRAGAKFPEGRNPDVKVIRLTVDPVGTAARPFLWYVIVGISNFLVRWRFESRWQAHRGTYDGLDYILRVPPNWSPTTGQRPIVFLHGLGLGLLQYFQFLEVLFKAEPDRPFLIPLLPHVSQEIFHPRYLQPFGRHESVKCIGGLIRKLGWVEDVEESETDAKDVLERPSGVTLLSHSNGTFVHCWLLKAFPHMFTRSCFVDPVVFCLWEGDLCYNFVYRPCSTGIELIIKYFVGMDLGVAYYIQRHFCWSSNTLWFDEIPNGHDPTKTMFIVGGKDDIVNGPRVRQYLQSHGVNQGLLYNPKGRHGQALLTHVKAFREILKWLREPTNTSP